MWHIKLEGNLHAHDQADVACRSDRPRFLTLWVKVGQMVFEWGTHYRQLYDSVLQGQH